MCTSRYFGFVGWATTPCARSPAVAMRRKIRRFGSPRLSPLSRRRVRSVPRSLPPYRPLRFTPARDRSRLPALVSPAPDRRGWPPAVLDPRSASFWRSFDGRG